MPHVIQLKDGKLLIAFEIRDVLEVVENYIGQETRKYIEEYLEENIQIQRILKHSLPSMKRRSIRWVTTSAIYSATFWKKWTHWMDFCGSRD